MSDRGPKALPSLRAMGTATAVYAAYFIALFSPAFRTGRLLAPGDATGEYVPQFLTPASAWNPSLFTGFPLDADPQNATWSPLRAVFRVLAHVSPFSWNLYVLAICVLCAISTFLYVHHFTREWFGAVIGGLIYASSGYMLRNVAETPIVASAAFTPLVFLAIERLRDGGGVRTSLVGACALGCCLLAGHPQVFFYTAATGAAYAVFRFWWAARRRAYIVLVGAMFVLGIGLTAVQLLPSAELVRSSERQTVPFAQFAGWSWSALQTFELFIPNAFWGKLATKLGSNTTCTVARWSEHAYPGLAALVLSPLGLASGRKERTLFFWLGVMVFSLLFAYGPLTPLARLVYHLPGYDKFRVPVRHMQFFSLGGALLAGYGVKGLAEAKRLAPPAAALAACWIGIAVAGYEVTTHACIDPWGAPLLIAVAVGLALTGAVVLRTLRPSAAATAWGLVAATALDLGSFGPHLGPMSVYPLDVNARDGILDASTFTDLPHALAPFRDRSEASKQRVWPVRGAPAANVEGPANRSMVWGVRSASGYFPLAPKPLMDLLRMAPAGDAYLPWWLPEDRALDVSAIRYVTYRKMGLEPTSQVELGIHLDDVDAKTYTFHLAAPGPVTGFTIVGSPDFVRGVPLGTALLEVGFEGALGTRTERLAYGPDLEDAVACAGDPPDAGAPIIFATVDPVNGRFCQIRQFDPSRSFPDANLGDVSTVTFRWVAPHGLFTLRKLTLQTPSGQRPIDIATEAILADHVRWSVIDGGDGLVVFENHRAVPRARWVDQPIVLPPAEGLAVIHSGHLADGADFDPAHAAVIVAPLAEPVTPECSKNSKLTWARDDDTRVDFDVSLAADCMLVLADGFAKGWHAYADGVARPVHRADHAFRAVVVPRGTHRLSFVYEPASRRLGFAITGATLALGLALLLLRRRFDHFRR